jgi:type IV pilus assembly protein PilE
MKRMNQSGFTLIELMIAVAVVAILAAVAIPSYKSYVIKASRQAAQTELLQLAGLQEKIYLNSSVYATSVTDAYNGTSGGGLGRGSAKTNDGKYDLAFTGTPAQNFTLTATPVATSTQVGDGVISISETGSRLWNGKTW